MLLYAEEQWISWMDKLALNDYLVVDNFIPDGLYDTITNYFSVLEENERLKKAGIGTSTDYQIKNSVRGDLIYWLDEKRDKELSVFYDLMNELSDNLRRFCFISLSGHEFHLAKYPAGTRYQRHIDQLDKRNNRQITILIYLNKDWKVGDGGELKIYGENENALVEPLAKRLLMFKSDLVEHEVLTTMVPRYSLTGWLLHQPASLGYLFG